MTTKELYDQPALRTIRLYGKLGAKFGRVHRLAVNSTAEAVRALCVLYHGFEAYMLNARDQGMGFAVFLGKTNVGEESLLLNTQQDIRIAPVLMGSKNSGIVSVILGVALVAVSFLIPGAGMFAAGLFNAGVAMALGGVVQLLSPQPKDPKSKDKPEDEPNYAFNGPVNTQAQGNCVPVAYGRPWTGSAVISAGISTDDVYVPATTPGSLQEYLLATNPAFLYPCNDDPLSDATGNNPDLIPTGNYSVGNGITFSGSPPGSASATASLLVGGAGYEACVMIRVQVNDIATTPGKVSKHIFASTTNYALGLCHWGINLRGGADQMTPVIIVNGMGGAGIPVDGPAPFGVGEIHTIGWIVRKFSGISKVAIIIDGVPSGWTNATGTFSGAGDAAIGYGTMKANEAWAIGWNYAPTDAELLERSNYILQGYVGTIESGDSDNNPPEEI